MTEEETAKLLTLAAMVDNRPVSEESVIVWAEVLGNVSYEDACEALREHYRHSTAWLMPANIISIVASIKKRRTENATMSPATPEDCGDHLWVVDGSCAKCLSWRPDAEPRKRYRRNAEGVVEEFYE